MEIEKIICKMLPAFVMRRLEGRPNFQKLLFNTGWLFVDKILRMGVGLIVGVWVARYLGPQQYGIFSYAQAFVILFSAVASLGLDNIVVRDLVKNPENSRQTLGSAFVLKLCGGLLTIVLTYNIIGLVRPGDAKTQLLVGIIAAGTVFQAFDTIDFWFQSQVKSKFTVFAKNGAFILISLVKVALILKKASLEAFAWAGFAEVVIGSLGLLIAYRLNRHSVLEWKWSFNRSKELLKDSWPLIFSGILIMIYMRIDQIMLRELAGEREVGIYSAAVRLAEVWYFIPTVVVSSVFPSIVEAKKISDQVFYDKVQKLYNLMAFSGYIVAIPMTFLSGPLVAFLYGKEFLPAGPMLAVSIWTSIFVNLGVARSSFLTTMNWTKVHLLTTFAGCVVNVALNLYLIPVLGGMGAAIASLAAYWVAAHGSCFVYRPLFKTGMMLSKSIIFPNPRGL